MNSKAVSRWLSVGVNVGVLLGLKGLAVTA